MTPNIPVIFTHYGDWSVVDVAIQQAQRRNSRVILLGDRPRETCITEYYRAQEYTTNDEYVSRFTVAYQHMHTNPNEKHRLYCYLRWFYILSFMEKHSIQRVFVADSDLMLYADVAQIANAWGDYEILLVVPLNQVEYRWSVSAHASYWSYRGLRLFCDFMLQAYTEDTILQQLQEKWQHHQDTKTPGGICIMTMLYLFKLQYPELVGNLLCPVETPWHAFDLSINTSENMLLNEYETHVVPEAVHGQFKQITWIDQQPYGNNLRLQCPVRFDGIHFQGGVKDAMQDYSK